MTVDLMMDPLALNRMTNSLALRHMTDLQMDPPDDVTDLLDLVEDTTDDSSPSASAPSTPPATCSIAIEHPKDGRALIFTNVVEGNAVHLEYAPLMLHVERCLSAALPDYPLNLQVTLRGDSTHTLNSTLSQAQLILLNTSLNIYLVVYPTTPDSPEWLRMGCTFDLTDSDANAYEHPLTPPTVKLFHALLFRALRAAVGMSVTPPQGVIRAMIKADAVGELSFHDVALEWDEDEFIDPEVFGG